MAFCEELALEEAMVLSYELLTYLLTYLITYLFTYLLTYSLHGAQSFLRI